MSNIRIKLNKFVAGDQKRLFQSDIQVYDDQSQEKTANASINISNSNTKKNSYQNTVFYGKYSLLLKANYLEKNDAYVNSLLDFNEVQPRYVNEKQIFNIKSQFNTSQFYLNLFQQNQKKEQQNIFYFNANLQHPIDIEGIQNMAYMLSPLNSKKQVQIQQPSSMYFLKDFQMSADYKDHYGEMYKFLLNRQREYPENQSIPIYDLNFTNLQTITFDSLQKLTSFLQKYQLDKLKYNDHVISSLILLNINNKFNEYDSIDLSSLINIISDKSVSLYFYDSTRRLLFKDLVDNIEQTSFNCSLSKIGEITNLSNQTKKLYLTTELLSTTFNLPKEQIYSNLENVAKDDFYINAIPKNSLYVLKTNDSLVFQDDKKSISYMNFVNLKNMQTPLEDFQLQLDTSIKGYSQLVSSQESKLLYNKKIADLFDNDLTKSYEFNKDNTYDIYKSNRLLRYTYIPTKNITNLILQTGAEYDTNLSKSYKYKSDYQKYSQVRLQKKINDYLLPFYQRNISQNKTFEYGQLYGLRSYLKSGILDSEKNIWLSYKYVTSKNLQLLNEYNMYYQLPFYEYELNRENHMEKNYLGTIYKGIQDYRITKTANNSCPYLKNFKSLAKEDFHCPATQQDICKGYCTFPLNNQYLKYNGSNLYPLGKYWDYNEYYTNYQYFNNLYEGFKNNNSQWFYFSYPLNLSSTIYAETQLTISDDIEIYFSNMELNEFNHFIQNNGPYYKSIFRGFGGANSGQNFSEYLMINNKDVQKIEEYQQFFISEMFYSIKQIVGNQMTKYRELTLQSLFQKPLFSFIKQKYLEQYLNAYPQLRPLFSKSINDLLLLDKNQAYKDFKNISFKKLLYNTSFVSEVNAFKDIYYHKIYYDSLYEYIKHLYLNKDLKIQELQSAKRKIGNILVYNNFVIPEKSPFNGPHKIQKGTILTGLEITKENGTIFVNQVVEKIRPNYYCYIRVVNWWSNIIKFTGSIKQKIQLNDIMLQTFGNYTKILTTLNNYDYLEKVDGFFKAQQVSFKKSNIYSIKVTNSGFNPENDLNLSNFYDFILLKNYSYLPKQHRIFYDFYSIQNVMLEETTNYKNYVQHTILYTLYTANKSNSDLNQVKDFIKFYQYDQENGLLTLENYKNSLSFSYIQNQGGIYKLNKEYVKSIINAKKQLRQIFESTIKSSTKKYMPLHTDLWKIIYSGK